MDKHIKSSLSQHEGYPNLPNKMKSGLAGAEVGVPGSSSLVGTSTRPKAGNPALLPGRWGSEDSLFRE